MRYSCSVILCMLFLVLILVGCRTVEESMTYYQACMDSPECVEQMKLAENVAHVSLSTAVETVPAATSVAEIVGGIGGAVVAYFVGVIRGKRIMKG